MKILYGIQPSGRLHIGNYLGGLKDAIELKATILIADYHALTSTDKITVAENTHLLIKQLKEMGVNNFEMQTSENTKLAWEIQCVTPMSDLQRMTQFKSKEGDCNSGLLTYPCLMASDIILFNPQAVIIGEDQIQHMEFYRRTCERMGIQKIATNLLTDTPRIMSISDPTKKMSKSLGDKHCLYIGDNEENAKKIKKAPTTIEGIENLKQISKGFGIEFDDSKCGESKLKLIEAVNNLNH